MQPAATTLCCLLILLGKVNLIPEAPELGSPERLDWERVQNKAIEDRWEIQEGTGFGGSEEEDPEPETENEPEAGPDPEPEAENEPEAGPVPEPEADEMSCQKLEGMLSNLTATVKVIEVTCKVGGLVSASALGLYIVYLVVLTGLAINRFVQQKEAEHVETHAKEVDRAARRLIKQGTGARSRRSRSPREDSPLALD